MRVLSGQLRRVAGATPGAANARRSWGSRSGLRLDLVDADGRRGRGEASPLPGYSADTEFQAEAELLAWLGRLPRQLDAPAAIFLAASELASPAARFAAETALLDLLGQNEKAPIWRLIGGRARSPIPLVGLLPAGLDVVATLAAADHLAADGVRHFKLKLGGLSFADDIGRLAALRGRFGHGVEIRLDANGLLHDGTPGELVARIAALAEHSPELLEEPGGSPDLASPFPLALDESLLDPAVRAGLPELLRRGAYRVVALKPMALGGFAVCLELARIATAAGCASFVTHLFDGRLGLAAAAHLAFALPGRVLPCGLARHPGLEVDADLPPEAPAFVGATEIALPAAPGLWGDA